MKFEERITKNNSYYDRFVSEVGWRSENRDFSKALEFFLAHADSTKTILDIGCGTGTHLANFQSRGFKAIGIEPSAKMRGAVSNRGYEVMDGSFETLEPLPLPAVAGIWCAASLLHVPEEELSATLKKLSDILPTGAPLYFTVRLGEGSKWDKYDDANADAARFIQLFSTEKLLAEISKLPFKDVYHWIEDSTWGRPSQWISVIARKA